MSSVLQSIRILLAAPSQQATDSDVLARLDAENKDSSAALIHQYGRMVLGVGRRILGNEHDAENDCQATFLLLAQNGFWSERCRCSLFTICNDD